MKKIAIVLVIFVAAQTGNAFQGSRLIQQDMQQYRKNQFLDAADEYNNSQQDIEEYDQHVSDNAHSPQISDLKAFFTEICGFMLVHYLIIRNTICEYGSEIKERISTWIHALMNK